MIINAISDLHYELNNPAMIKRAADKIIENNPDVLVVPGDIAVSYDALREVLGFFEKYKGKKIACLGNHDIWVTDKVQDSHEKSEKVIRILKEHGFNVLDENPVLIGRTAFVGNIGWYDYSFLRTDMLANYEFLNNPRGKKAKDIDEKYLAQKDFVFVKAGTDEMRRVIWNDIQYAKWNKSDKELTDDLASKLEKDIKSVYDSADNIVIVMHHLPFESLLVRKPSDGAWELTNAYMGSEKFGNIIKNYDIAAKHMIFVGGHTHERRHATVGNVACATVAFRREHIEPHSILLD